MNQPLQHPLPIGAVILVERRCEMTREIIVACQGQWGTNRTWWYLTDTGKRVNEYQILDQKS